MALLQIDNEAVISAANKIESYADEVKAATDHLTTKVNECINSGISGIKWARDLQQKLNEYAESNIAASIEAMKTQANNLRDVVKATKDYDNGI